MNMFKILGIKKVDMGSLDLDYDTNDYPDFCDITVYSGQNLDGSDLTEDELDSISHDDLYDEVVRRVF